MSGTLAWKSNERPQNTVEAPKQGKEDGGLRSQTNSAFHSPLWMTLASGPYHGQTIRMDGDSAVVTVQVEETTI